MKKVLLITIFVASYILLIWIFNQAYIEHNKQPIGLQSIQIDDKSASVFFDTNNYRESKGLKTLILNKKLIDAANAKAKSMCDYEYFSHDLPDGTPWPKFIIESGYKYQRAGENLSKGYGEDGVVQAWINSPKHEENLLGQYDEIGVGYSECGVKEYFVQEFATQAR